MRLIDEIYTRSPYYGARRMAAELNRMNLGFVVDRKRIGRLMQIMGIEALYPKPKLSRPDKEHVKHPYLLRGVEIERINQVWGTDITYIPPKLPSRMSTYTIDRFTINQALSVAFEVAF
jgi:putative transposase